jgi:hypothetical protein
VTLEFGTHVAINVSQLGRKTVFFFHIALVISDHVFTVLLVFWAL